MKTPAFGWSLVELESWAELRSSEDREVNRDREEQVNAPAGAHVWAYGRKSK